MKPSDDVQWRRASKCESGSCVEVAFHRGEVLVRDTKHPDGPVLAFSAHEWTAFVQAVRDDEFDHR